MTNILIAGVGGQGTLLASRVLGNYAIATGNDCKLSEVHGMSQRGGSVVTHVRIGKDVQSPIVPEGEADIVIAFEKLESARFKHYLKQGGFMVVNDQEIMPMPVITGAAEYPHSVLDEMRGEGVNLMVINAGQLAVECGNVKVANTIMIGALAKKLGFQYDNILEALKMTVPERFLDINVSALKKGYEIQD